MLKYKNCTIEFNGRDMYIIDNNNYNIIIKLYYDDDMDLLNVFTMLIVQEFDCEYCNINGNEYYDVHIKMEKSSDNKINIFITKNGNSIYNIN